jgi:hypothetical protein
MSDPAPLTADLLVDAEVSAEQERLLVDGFARLGVAARARVVPARRGVGDLSWLVLVSLPLQAFLTAVGSQLAEDAHHGLRDLVGRLVPSRDRPAAATPRPMVLRDAATGLQIVLEPDLPDDGYRQLVGLDLSRFRLGPVHYDRSLGRWRSELDEAGS